MNTISPRSRQNGFTVPELLVVLAVFVVMIVASMFLAHPRDYSVANRDAERRLGLAQLMQALVKYTANNGGLPDRITSKTQTIDNTKTGVNLCAILGSDYLSSMPIDPAGGISASDDCSDTSQSDSYTTGYTISRSSDGTLKIAAPFAEGGEDISISRKF